MARVPTLGSPQDAAPEHRHVADAIVESRGQLGPVWGTIMQSPEVAGRLAHLGTYIRFEAALPDLDRELAMIVTARHWDCTIEWEGHKKAAERFGATSEMIRVIEGDGDPSTLLPEHALLIRFARELLRTHKVSDSVFQQALARYGSRGVTDLVATIGYMSCVACLINALEVAA